MWKEEKKGVITMEFKDCLLYWRTKKNISVYKLAQLSGISENHIHSMERGQKQPTVKTVKAITDALKISISEFFNTDNPIVTYLSEGEKQILDLYRSLPPDKADILMDYYEKMCDK